MVAYSRTAALVLFLAQALPANAAQFGRRVATHAMPQWRFCGACVALIISLVGCSTLTSVPIRPSNSGLALLVPVEVNGVPATFLLDTGATNTVLSKQFANRIGLQSQAMRLDTPIETAAPLPVHGAHYVPLTKFRLGPIHAKRNSGEALIVDMSLVSEFAHEDIDGIVGNATLGSADFELVASRPSLKVGRSIELPSYGQAFPLRASGYRTYLPASINGKTFDFLLDTGSTRSYVSTEALQVLDGVHVERVELRGVSVNASETKMFERFHAAVTLGQVLIPEFQFLIGDTNRIGLDLLRHGELFVSVREGSFVFRDVGARTD